MQLNLEQTPTVWVRLLQVHISKLEGLPTVAIQHQCLDMGRSDKGGLLAHQCCNCYTLVPLGWQLLTHNAIGWRYSTVSPIGWLGLREYQVRDAKSLKRDWILVFTAYTFILWHQLTGGFRRQWATQPIHTFVEALEALRTAVEFRFVRWLNTHIDVFAAHKANSGYIWA